MQPEPIFDLAHLGHLELLTPKPDESLHFFVDVMGMTESGRQGDSVYLRGWDDYERHTLKLTASKTSGHGPHGVPRAQPAGAGTARRGAERIRLRHRLDRRRSRRTARRFVCQDPDGHKIELYYETEWYQAAARTEAGAEESGAAFSGARRQCPPPRSSELPGGRHQGQPDFLREVSRLPPDRADRAQRRHGSGDVDDLHQQELRLRLFARSHRHAGAVSTTSPTRSTAARTSCAPPISFWRTASTSRPGRTSTPSSRRFSCMSTNPAATAWRSPMPARG